MVNGAGQVRRLSTVDAIAQLAFLVHGTLETRAAERDLSVVQTRLLGVLRDRTPTMSELAALLGLDKSSVTGLVDRAQRRGLVERRPSPTDGRAVTIALTRRGRAEITAAASDFAADVARLVGSLPARDRAALTDLLSRVLATQAAERGVELFPDDATPSGRSRR